jgi:hypothetical protein
MIVLEKLDLYVLKYAASNPSPPWLLALTIAWLSGGPLTGWKRVRTLVTVFLSALDSIDRLKKAGLLKEDVDALALQAGAGDNRTESAPRMPTVLSVTEAGMQRLAV